MLYNNLTLAYYRCKTSKIKVKKKFPSFFEFFLVFFGFFFVLNLPFQKDVFEKHSIFSFFKTKKQNFFSIFFFQITFQKTSENKPKQLFLFFQLFFFLKQTKKKRILKKRGKPKGSYDLKGATIREDLLILMIITHIHFFL